MATIITRAGKGSPLSNTEVDTNFTNLNTELATKVSTSNAVFTTAASIPTSSSFQITANNIPQVRPTLQLDFLNSTKLDPRITFSRSTTATRVNSLGVIETVAINTPRFDYDPVTKKPLGFLIESTRINVIPSSGNPAVTHQLTVSGGSGTFQNGETVTATGGGTGQYNSVNSTTTVFGIMNGTNTLTAATGTLTGNTSGATRTLSAAVKTRSFNNVTVTPFVDTAPDGTQTATRLTETLITGPRGASLLISANVTLNLYYTVSVYAKAQERTQLIIGAGTNAAFNPAQYGKFDLSTGVASIFAGTPTVSIMDAGNGWYRCTVVIRATATSTSNIDLQLLNETGTNEYTGETTSGLLIWGLQLETGENATSYIPTTTAQVTRALDLAIMNSVVPWYNQTEGTIFAQFRAGSVNYPTSTQPILQLGSTVTNTNNIYMARTGGAAARARFVSRTPLGADVDITAGSGIAIPPYSVARVAGAIATNNYIVVHKGILGTTDTSAIVPYVESLTLGWYIFGTVRLDGHLQCVRYYPKRLSNTELQALTT